MRNVTVSFSNNIKNSACWSKVTHWVHAIINNLDRFWCYSKMGKLGEDIYRFLRHHLKSRNQMGVSSLWHERLGQVRHRAWGLEVSFVNKLLLLKRKLTLLVHSIIEELVFPTADIWAAASFPSPCPCPRPSPPYCLHPELFIPDTGTCFGFTSQELLKSYYFFYNFYSFTFVKIHYPFYYF